MNYQVIVDPDKLKEFIGWLPELTEDETYYLCLFARSKYCKGIAHVRSDKAQLKRFTSNKSRMYEKIMQLECPIGAYTFREVGSKEILAVPQEALALYVTINPRSFKKANTAAVRKLLDLALQPYNGFHPHQEVMSEVQKNKSRTCFVTFDFDIDKTLWPMISTELTIGVNPEAVRIVETRGGFHVIVEPILVHQNYTKSWYNNLKALLNKYSDDKDNCGDVMLPVPGTYQGGFVPKLFTVS